VRRNANGGGTAAGAERNAAGNEIQLQVQRRQYAAAETAGGAAAVPGVMFRV